MTDPCVGCQTYGCDYKYYAKNCPCIKCLVKVTCKEYCQLLQSFVDERQKQRRKELQETWL